MTQPTFTHYLNRLDAWMRDDVSILLSQLHAQQYAYLKTKLEFVPQEMRWQSHFIASLMEACQLS